ncbi:MAG: FAD-binding protein [Deltaproteobacteria bacterium]|jgi:succinate dehydrogenase/fumarate reductase flavoprotein subunit|nr:FAD-binding protein [Deltaproteobacteria bacterium]MBT4642729.1 FAD-binding protein [Deltaproteobacteria bacterium]MBT6503250.1 FAD-binding protein [Deltaproteobacteria bacterium]MBT7154994.1 FAD-binding protein [Deltaproteobacteria bacterium]MBT7710737.1 FAD-binding protein [Deltaproteobacteria bacterium]
MTYEKLTADVLIIGMGAAAQIAALNAFDANPELDILIVTKALQGKGGCSRMVQGGFNVVLNPEDSHDKHFMDTLKGGQYINDQILARTLVEQGTPTIKEMETLYGCFFDRNQDGTVHQKPFAGQSYDRTVHKGDLTGIEIVSRLTEQVMKRNIRVLEENRALELLLDASGEEVTGALLLDIKQGIFREVNARCVLVATGGGPTQYRFFAPGPEKSVDGMGMLYRAGVLMRDMEMVQFHPTGLIIPGSVVAGSLLEEGLRGAGAYMLNGNGERFMENYDPENMERTTRDVMSRSSFLEMQAGRACPEGGVHIVASHLGADFVEQNFPGMCSRCRQFKYDLAREPVPVSPSAHYVMGGADIDKDCMASRERLFVAGEDTGGVHGANRLGGNGIADSCVFGRQAGKGIATYMKYKSGALPETAPGMVDRLINEFAEPFSRAKGTDHMKIRDELREMNWNKIGVARTGEGLSEALAEISGFREQVAAAQVPGKPAYNLSWNFYIDLLNMIDVSQMVAGSAVLREEKRGAHFRQDHPEQDDSNGLFNVFQKRGSKGEIEYEKRPVNFILKSAEECRSYKKQ